MESETSERENSDNQTTDESIDIMAANIVASNINASLNETGMMDPLFSQSTPMMGAMSCTPTNFTHQPPLVDAGFMGSQMNMNLQNQHQLLNSTPPIQQHAWSDQDYRLSQQIRTLLRDHIDQLVEARVATATNYL